jgi:hypothetical protein
MTKHVDSNTTDLSQDTVIRDRHYFHAEGVGQNFPIDIHRARSATLVDLPSCEPMLIDEPREDGELEDEELGELQGNAKTTSGDTDTSEAPVTATEPTSTPVSETERVMQVTVQNGVYIGEDARPMPEYPAVPRPRKMNLDGLSLRFKEPSAAPETPKRVLPERPRPAVAKPRWPLDWPVPVNRPEPIKEHYSRCPRDWDCRSRDLKYFRDCERCGFAYFTLAVPDVCVQCREIELGKRWTCENCGISHFESLVAVGACVACE